MTKAFQLSDFLEEYNNLISTACLESKGKFAALASPTLNKQETITFLFQRIIECGKERNDLAISIRNIFLFIPRIFYHFINLTFIAHRFKVKSIPQNSIFIRTWLVPRSIVGYQVRDDYFRKLIDDLKINHSVVVGFQLLDYGFPLKQFKRAEKDENFIIPIGLLSFKDIVFVFVKYIFSAKLKLKNKYFYKGKDITGIINKSLDSDFYRLRSFQAYLESAIAKKLKVFNPKILLYIFENQAWEKAYLKAFEDTETITIGYQTSGFSLRFLNFFPARLDLENALFPDKIFTVGELFTNTLKNIGHYPIPIETFSALRFEYPSVNGKYIVEYPCEVIYKRILYAFPVHVYQYIKIIKLLIEIFIDTEIEVHLKFHPLYNPDDMIEKIPHNFKIWNKDQTESLKELYDAVLFNDNSFGIEALMGGVRSFEFEFGEIYPETRLISFDCYDAVMDKVKLIELKDQILSGSFVKKMNHEAIVNYINKHYIPYTKVMASFFSNN